MADQPGAELRREGSSIGDEAGSQRNVAHHKLDVLLQDFARGIPAHRLVAQASQQLLGSSQLHLASLCVLFQFFSFAPGSGQLQLKTGHIVLDGFQFLLLCIKFGFGCCICVLSFLQFLFLGLNGSGHPGIHVHGSGPHAQRHGSSGHFLYLIRLEVISFYILLQLLCQLHIASQGILVVVLEALQETGVVHQLFRLIPTLLAVHQQTHRTQHRLHQGWWLSEGLHLLDVLLIQRVQCLDGVVVLRQGLIELLLAVILDGCRCRGRLHRFLLIHFAGCLGFLGNSFLSVHLHNQSSCILLALLNDRLQLGQIHLQLIDHGLGLFETLCPNLVAVQLHVQFTFLHAQQVGEELDQFQVGRWCHVRLASELVKEPLRGLRGGSMDHTGNL
mmetsp:Transcript_6531/g.14751  ORF Transcript_6531/g.14751 Transcript_6531/m.14751 type:complete len:388 (+) Transcript_6531:1480-2643(+)